MSIPKGEEQKSERYLWASKCEWLWKSSWIRREKSSLETYLLNIFPSFLQRSGERVVHMTSLVPTSHSMTCVLHSVWGHWEAGCEQVAKPDSGSVSKHWTQLPGVQVYWEWTLTKAVKARTCHLLVAPTSALVGGGMRIEGVWVK